MKTETDSLDKLSDQISVLEANADGAGSVVANFSEAMKKMLKGTQAASAGTHNFTRSLERSLKGAFEGVVRGERQASDALRRLGTKMVDAFYEAATQPLRDTIQKQTPLPGTLAGGFLKDLLGFSEGGSFLQGRVMPFANGGIVSRAAMFPMRGGRGLMGEAGPEAIMPLARGADGKLGVRSDASKPINITMNIQTRDAESFQRSKSQIAADVSRALSRGQRNR